MQSVPDFCWSQLHCEVIADGIHLSEDMLRLIYKTIGPERIILITDSMRAKGLPDGTYTLADQDVKVVGRKATLDNGTLAGSVLKMDEAVRMMRKNRELRFDRSYENVVFQCGKTVRRV